MSDPEKQLRTIRPAGPSAKLDRRMDELLDETVAGPVPVQRRNRFPWWFAVLPAASAVAALLFMLHRPPVPPLEEPSPSNIHFIEPQGLMRELLMPSPAQPPDPSHLPVSVHR